MLHRYYGLLRLLIRHPPGFHLYGLYHSLRWRYTTDRMRPLLFHHLLSQHPALPTPESSLRLLFRISTASIAFAMRDRLGSLFFPFRSTCRCCKTCPEPVEGLTLCYGLLFCFPFSGSYNASTQSVTRLHWLPAIRRPDTYRNWTSTSEQTMIYQDTPRFVRQLLNQKTLQDCSVLSPLMNKPQLGSYLVLDLLSWFC